MARSNSDQSKLANVALEKTAQELRPSCSTPERPDNFHARPVSGQNAHGRNLLFRWDDFFHAIRRKPLWRVTGEKVQEEDS